MSKSKKSFVAKIYEKNHMLFTQYEAAP